MQRLRWPLRLLPAVRLPAVRLLPMSDDRVATRVTVEREDGDTEELAMQEWFVKLPKISIDFAVMEKSDKVYAIQLDCQWLDMGSFAALADAIKANEDELSEIEMRYGFMVAVEADDELNAADCEIERVRTEARSRHGWIMDTYLLRKT